ncbi:GTP-binding protein [Stenotrophomonas sp. ATCM1_4]|jgi:small GTP-binding protein|uniref:GTP-binding protein n=1 Tax=Stenotrophomonas capsici TaxID=3110230 RepID=A0ABU5V2M6_9GAMM|nr:MULTISPECIES: ATP/GTP-binding protein [unclassified Stenotrophomonas]MEA5667616.1 GTP-binding protein [Stenotrophomonas sp. MH1]TDB29441.1 GTP-binding protein [Stenotrophomonas sp. ATCM1_4]
MIEHKIVVLGAMGAGKSTLVRAVAGGTVIDTDVLNTDVSSSKLATTVAMDYADVSLPNGDRLRLYGTPGQERFSFIWPVLLQGARGVVILADASSPEVATELDTYLRTLRTHADRVPAVVGVSKFDLVPDVDLDACQLRVQEVAGRPLPLVPFDARSEDEVMMLMDVLMGEVEAAALVEAHG